MVVKKKAGQPYYSLKSIRELVLNDHFYVHKRNARDTAKRDFGWTEQNIKKALLTLQNKHFHKSAENWDDPSIHVDYYKARGLMGENVYIHFHVDEDGNLIISSFKEI